MSKMTSEGRRACFFAFGEAAETEEKRRGDGSDSAGVKLNLEVEVSSQGLAKGYRKLSFRSYSPSRLMLTRIIFTNRPHHAFHPEMNRLLNKSRLMF